MRQPPYSEQSFCYQVLSLAESTSYAYVRNTELGDKGDARVKALNLLMVVTLLYSQTALCQLYPRKYPGGFLLQSSLLSRKYRNAKTRVAKSIYNEERVDGKLGQNVLRCLLLLKKAPKQNCIAIVFKKLMANILFFCIFP